METGATVGDIVGSFVNIEILGDGLIENVDESVGGLGIKSSTALPMPGGTCELPNRISKYNVNII